MQANKQMWMYVYIYVYVYLHIYIYYICTLNKSICAQKYIENRPVHSLVKTRPWPWKPRGRFWTLKCLFTRLLAQEGGKILESWRNFPPFLWRFFRTHLNFCQGTVLRISCWFSAEQNGKETQLTFLSMTC